MQALGASTLTSWWEMNISKATSKGKEAVGEINLIASSASGESWAHTSSAYIIRQLLVHKWTITARNTRYIIYEMKPDSPFGCLDSVPWMGEKKRYFVCFLFFSYVSHTYKWVFLSQEASLHWSAYLWTWFPPVSQGSFTSIWRWQPMGALSLWNSFSSKGVPTEEVRMMVKAEIRPQKTRGSRSQSHTTNSGTKPPFPALWIYS